ncbi:MAG TPA: prolipoprotein diacylglyceryl transferase [Caldilineaceae bacterium]|nr:prolipoprotein diacylglyceryl transferase [Caldilineaceae bacterium]
MQNVTEHHSILDRIVQMTHQIHLRGHKVHPYLLLLDLGVCVVFVFAFFYTRLFTGISFLQFLLLFVITFAGYEFFFLRMKRRLFRIRSRSYLQDVITWILPVYVMSAWAIGASVPVALDLLGLLLPLWLSFVRIGCFLGGCCYGLPSRVGVLYPDQIFVPYESNCGKFQPGANPNCRVFPIQLVESAVNFCIFWVLFMALYKLDGVTGYGLPLCFISYCVYRFIGDFFRYSSARPRYGIFSEAQLVSLALLGVLVGWLLL